MKLVKLPTMQPEHNEVYAECTDYIVEGKFASGGYRRVKYDALGFYIVVNKKKVYFKGEME